MHFCRPALWAALVLCSGCATRLEPAGSRAEWQRLCRSMEASCTFRPAGSVKLDERERRRLELQSREAARAVVWISTVCPRRSRGEAATEGASVRHARGSSGGSGIVIGTDGTVLTCAHVVRDADSVVVVLPDGGRYSARRMIVSETDDLAVIRIGRSMPRTLALGGPPEPAGGVAALAGPLLPAGRVRAGAVTSASCCLQRELDPAARCDYSELVESTADVQGGFSGGPMLDAEGVVVGVTVAAAGQGPTARAYAVPMTPRIRREIDRLRARLDG